MLKTGGALATGLFEMVMRVESAFRRQGGASQWQYH
jgi:hypothetical protein